MARRLGLAPWDFAAAADDPAKVAFLLREEAVEEYELAVENARLLRALGR